LFVPFAAADYDAYYQKAKARFNSMGFECESLHLSSNPRSSILSAEACFIGGGNTFLLLKTLQDLDCVSAIREA
jgi:dipeptidase E